MGGSEWRGVGDSGFRFLGDTDRLPFPNPVVRSLAATVPLAGLIGLVAIAAIPARLFLSALDSFFRDFPTFSTADAIEDRARGGLRPGMGGCFFRKEGGGSEAWAPDRAPQL